jgi:pimeloyl-ACP methyl ester carboxylesterase
MRDAIWVTGLLLTCGIAGASSAPLTRGGQFVAVAPHESLFVTQVGPSGGTPIVILPSLVGSAVAFRRVAQLLAASHHRVLIIDPLGMGGSPRPRGADYALAAQARRGSRAIEQLCTQPAVLIATGVSASIAWRVAAAEPARVAGVVSIEGGLVESQATPGLTRLKWMAPLANTPWGRRLARHRFRSMLVTGSASSAWITDSTVDSYLAPVVADLPATLHVWSSMAAARDADSTTSAARRITQPVRLLVGGAPSARQKSGGVPGREVEQLRALLRTLQVDTIDGSGWFVHEEQPLAVVRAVELLDAAHRVTAGRIPD